MKRLLLFVAMATLLTSACCQNPKCTDTSIDSGTTYALEALQPWVDSGQLSGAISVFYKDGVQEVCCAGYADVAAKRPISMDNSYMQCSQPKGFCGVTVAKLIEVGRLELDAPV